MKCDKALIFEISKPGRCALDLPACDIPQGESERAVPEKFLRSQAAALPEVSQLDLVRHYTAWLVHYEI